MSDPLDVRLRRGLIRLFEGGIKRRPVFRYWRELEASQWLDAAQLETLRTTRLAALLHHAARHSPWYAAGWAALELDPSQVTSTAELARWPLIDRDTIRAHRHEMRSTAPGTRLIAKATGGSSGVPLQFDLDTDSNERRMAAWHRGYGWAGAPPGTRQWYLWGVPPDATAEWRKRKVRWYDALYRRTTESCFELADAAVERFAASLERTRPHAIVAYTGAIHSFARMLEARGLVPYAPASIVVGAEQLHDFQRETIERVFRAPVFETYGSREFMLIGSECELHNGLHVTAEQLIVELVDADGAPVPAGVEGDVVITDLTNTGMPFIRYRNGDRAIAATGTCPCGRGLPRLEAVTGRRLDVITTPDGRELPGEFFPHILKEFSAVQRFQVEQDDPDVVTVRLVAPDWSEADAARLRREVAAVAGGALQVRVEQVPDIPLTAAGKLKVVVNRLAERTAAVRT
jgi:phenylacetate-CoA ligase